MAHTVSMLNKRNQTDDLTVDQSETDDIILHNNGNLSIKSDHTKQENCYDCDQSETETIIFSKSKV